ncbi:hypothetical protein V8F06_003057 [Rhypophila decipiens]
MVYCGQPSRGCQMCRTRRIKCDETRPTCKQCAKSRRQCPGYKDEFDLMLRNETRATERRAQRANKKALWQLESAVITSSSSTNVKVSPAARSAAKCPFEQALKPAIPIPAEMRASCHFLSNFVLVPQMGSTRGFMAYLIPLIKSEDPDGQLHHAFNACALASLANTTTSAKNSNKPPDPKSGRGQGAVELHEKAFAEYSKALRATNIVLRDPEAYKSDAVLAAILLLAVFENITAQEAGAFAWGTHIGAAIQIAQARGRKQLRTKLGLQIFIAVRTQCIIHTLTTGKAPVMGADWWLQDAVSDPHASAAQRLSLKTSELRAEVTATMATLARTPDNVEIMRILMRRAQSLDKELASWMDDLPDMWHWKTICWQGPLSEGEYSEAEVFPGRVDIYNDFWIASVINVARTTRLYLGSIIVRCAAWICSPVDYRTTPEYAGVSRVCADTISDIIASIPYHLGWHIKRRHLFPNHALSGFACGEDDGAKGLGGYFLTWPLATVVSQDYATDNQRAYVKGRLRFIADGLGIKYGHILSQLQIRLPSMLIHRDGLLAQPFPMAHNFQKILTLATRGHGAGFGPGAAAAAAAAGYKVNPLQQREMMVKEEMEKRRAELIAKAIGPATGTTGESVKHITKDVLSI